MEFKKEIENYLKFNKPCFPPHFNETFIESSLSELNEISISRPKNRVSWGISTPDIPDQTVYVWLDALCNYLTCLDYLGENQKDQGYFENFIHIIGKDIVKFHAVYWPGFLAGLGLPFPKKIFVHDHWIYQGVFIFVNF